MSNLFTDDAGCVGSMVAWSPDGATLLTVTHDGVMRIWNAHTGDLLYHLESPREWYRDQDQTSFPCVAWSPDGRYIVAGTQLGQIFLWDCETRQIVQVMRSHYASVTALDWSPRGDRLASASYDGTVKVWKVGELLPILTYFGHRRAVYDVAWSPDGTYLASAGYDRTVQIWRSGSGRRVQTYHGHRSAVRSLSWSTDGSQLASTGEDDTLQVWHAAIGGAWWRRLGGVKATRIAHVSGRLAIHLGQQVEWSRDGRLLALRSITGIQLFCAKTRAYIDSYADTFVQCFAFSPDGSRLAVASASKVSFWRVPRL